MIGGKSTIEPLMRCSEILVTSETGAGLSYRTQFATWRKLFQRLFGRNKSNAAADSTGVVVDAGDR